MVSTYEEERIEKLSIKEIEEKLKETIQDLKKRKAFMKSPEFKKKLGEFKRLVEKKKRIFENRNSLQADLKETFYDFDSLRGDTGAWVATQITREFIKDLGIKKLSETAKKRIGEALADIAKDKSTELTKLNNEKGILENKICEFEHRYGFDEDNKDNNKWGKYGEYEINSLEETIKFLEERKTVLSNPEKLKAEEEQKRIEKEKRAEKEGKKPRTIDEKEAKEIAEKIAKTDEFKEMIEEIEKDVE